MGKKTRTSISYKILALVLSFSIITLEISPLSLLLTLALVIVLSRIFPIKGGAFIIYFLLASFILFQLNLVFFINFHSKLKDTSLMIKGDETIIVLGARVTKDGPSDVLRTRLDKAGELAQKYKDTKIIVSGFKGKFDFESEASGMKKYLVKIGVEASRIYEEGKSKNTIENIQNSVELSKKLGLNNKYIIVTNDFHLSRALFIARLEGIDAIGIMSSTPFSSRIYNHIREYTSLIKVFFRYYLGLRNF